MCVGGVFHATSVDVSTKDGNSDQQSHVIVTCMSHDLQLLSSINLAHNGEQKSNLYLHTVSIHTLLMKGETLLL